MLRPLSEKHPDVAKVYYDGKYREQVVATWMRELGYEVRMSTPEEDFYQDIDMYIKKPANDKWISVSVKANEPKYQHSAFIFEQKFNGKYGWCDSWYRKGKAEVYLVLKQNHMNGGDLYAISKKKVVEFVNANGWDGESGYRDEAFAETQKLNGMYGVLLGMLNIKTVLDNQLGRRIGSKKSIIKKREAA